MLLYAQIEDAICSRIKLAESSLGYKLAHVDSYGGEFDQEGFWESFRRFPAVWVTFGGEKSVPVTPGVTRHPLTMVLMVGTRSPRGERIARRGFAGAPGSYQMLDDVRSLVCGQDFDLGIDAFKPGAVRTLYNTKIGKDGLSVLAQELTTSYTWRAPKKVEPQGDILEVALNHILKPGDDLADSQDIVTLTTP